MKEKEVSYDNVVITTDLGFVEVFEIDKLKGWAIAVWGHMDALGSCEVIVKAFADTEKNALVCADALAHAHICPDCHHAREKHAERSERTTSPSSH